MRDSKGRIMKGFKHSEESRRKISAGLTGRKASQKTIDIMKGNTFRKGIKHTEEWKKQNSIRNKGKVYSQEIRKKLSISKMGANNPLWKGGISGENKCIRNSAPYRNWRTSVFQRDNFTCTCCSKKGGWSKDEKRAINLQADHIKPFSMFPELRFELSNGRTLCEDCHRKTDTWGAKKEYWLSNALAT